MRSLTSRSTGLIAAFLACAWISHAVAQVTAVPPPIVEDIDVNGVNLSNGTMVATYYGPSIGPAGAQLRFTRTFRGVGVWDSFLMGTIVYASPDQYTVTVDGASTSFTETSPAVFSSNMGDGSELTKTGSTYTYVSRMGVATFEELTAPYNHPQDSVALLTTIVRPNGERVTVEYTNETVCLAWNPSSQSCTSARSARRFKSLTNNRGYKLEAAYAASGNVTDLEFFFMPVQVWVSNLTTGVPTQSVQMNHSVTGQNQRTYTFEDALQRTTEYTIGAAAIVSRMRTPGSSQDNITTTIHPMSVNNNGIVTNYGFSNTWTTQTVTVSRAGGGQRTVLSELSTNRILSDKDELNRETTYLYDGFGRVGIVTAPEGNSVVYSYDWRGNVTEVWHRAKPGSGLADIVTSAGFDVACSNPKTCNQPNWTRDGRGKQTDYTYDPVHGGVLTVTHPAPSPGAVRPQTRFSYTALEAWYRNSSGVIAASGQPISLLTGISTCRTLSSCAGTADELKTIINYGSPGVANNLWPTIVTTSDGTGALTSVVTATYDTAGNMTLVDGPLPTGADSTATHFDALRRIVGVVGPDPDGGGPRQHMATRHSYDTAGNVQTIESGTAASYGNWPNSFVPLESVALQHDSAGRILRTDYKGADGIARAVEQKSYDARGRIECVTTRMNPAVFASLSTSACTLGTTGSYGPDQISKATYNLADGVTKVTTGFSTADAIDASTVTYTNNGKRKTLADGKGNLTTFEYDGFDRLWKVRYPVPGTPGASSTTDFEQRTHDANSFVISVRTRTGNTIGFTPDDLGRLVVKDLPGTNDEDVYLSYDNQGRKLVAAYGSLSGPGMDYVYDGLGRLNTGTISGRTLTYSYNAAGQRTRITHPGGSFHADYAYNAAGEVTTITDSAGNTLATYNYDDLGRRTGIERDASGADTSLGYDAVSRLNELTHDLSGTNYDTTAAFSHSPSGQIATHTQSNPGAYTWTPDTSGTIGTSHNGLNQITQVLAITVDHDDLGNLETGESAFTYGYDLQNRLRSANTANASISLTYDPLGVLNLLSRSDASGTTTTAFLYDGMDLVAEYDVSTGAVVRRYVHGPDVDEPLVMYIGPGTSDRRYLHSDERGSIVAISNSAGSGLHSFKYSPWGESANADDSRFGYTGQLWLKEVGLYYYKSRMYSARLGRFLQPDSIGYAGGMNLYAYVGGDPINHVDPYGFNPVDPNAPDCDGLTHVCVSPRRPPYDTFERDLYFMEVLEELRNAFAINENPVRSQGNQQLHCTSGVPTSDPAAKNQRVFVGDEYGNAVFSYDLPVDVPTRTWGGNYPSSGTATGAGGGTALGAIAGGRIGATVGAAEGAHLGGLWGAMAVAETTFSFGVLGGVYGFIAGATLGLIADLRVQADLVEHCEPN